MNMKSQKLLKYAGIFSVVCGGLLISVPAISQTAVAQESNSATPKQTNSRVNPCPSIFYEEPFNNRVLVPEGCPANAITQRLANQGLLSTARAQTSTPATTSSPYQTGLGVGGETPQTNANRGQLNPCPQVYYQEPFNSRNLIPEGCPPNTFSQGRQSQGETSNQDNSATSQSSTDQSNLSSQGATSNQGTSISPQASTRGTTTQTPLPSQQQAPNATIALANGRVNINLVNDTAAIITYQVIGDTAPRTLPGKSNVMLQNVSAPVTVTFEREDGGLLTVTPQPSSEQQGMLEVRLNEATDVAQDRKAIRIQENGSIFLN